MAGLGLLDSMGDDGPNKDGLNQLDPFSNSNGAEGRSARIPTGKLNQGRRIDFMLHEKEIENANEYVATLAAHSCYWMEKDLSLFVAWEIFRSSLARSYPSRRGNVKQEGYITYTQLRPSRARGCTLVSTSFFFVPKVSIQY